MSSDGSAISPCFRRRTGMPTSSATALRSEARPERHRLHRAPMRALRIAAALLLVTCTAPLAAQDPRAARLAAAHTFPASELADRQAKFLAWLDTAGRSLSQDDALSAYESL